MILFLDDVFDGNGDTLDITKVFDIDIYTDINFGADKEEALLNAVDALETGLSFYVESRKPLPLPSKAKRGEITVSAAALERATLVLGRHIEVRVAA